MRLTLKYKLIIVSVAATLIMATALTWISLDSLYTQTRKEVYERAQTLADTASKGIEDWLSARKNISDSAQEFTDNSAVVDFLRQARNAGGFDDIFYGTVRGEMLRSHPERNRADYDPRKRPWYQDAVSAGHQIVTTAYSDAITNELLITIATPIRRQGQLDGVLGADVLIGQLVKNILSFNVGQNAYAMLIDTQDSSLLAHPEKDLLLKPTTDLDAQLSLSNIKRWADQREVKVLDVKGKEKWFYFAHIDNTPWIFAIEMDAETENQALSSLRVGLFTTVGIITLFVIALLSWLISLQLRDLGRVTTALADIASGDADLTRRLTPQSDDEVGALANNFNAFASTIHGLMQRMKQVANSLAEQSNQSESSAEQRRQQVRHQQDEITMVATAIDQMAAATREISANADHTASNASSAVDACNQGEQQVHKTQQAISKLADGVGEATLVIQELETHGQSINSILSAIQGIAEQTNLLALNAAIEAARAGEQGRGFAVVADEVRVLSQRTHASTEEIQQMLEVLQNTTGKAVTMMEASRQLAGDSVNEADQAAQALTTINQSVSLINDMATQIAAASEEQALVTNEITRNSQQVKDVSLELDDDAQHAMHQASELRKLSQQLQHEISQFKL